MNVKCKGKYTHRKHTVTRNKHLLRKNGNTALERSATYATWFETCMICVSVFYLVRKEMSIGSDIKIKSSPKTPIVKSPSFGNAMYYMTLPKLTSFTMVVYWEILCILPA